MLGGGARFRTVQIDAALPLLHGRNGEDGTVQGAFELAGIPVVGCGAECSALCMDKRLAHVVAGAAGVPAPRSVLVRKREFECAGAPDGAASVGFPCFVKPVRSGSSIGISLVERTSELEAALELAFERDDEALVEERVDGAQVGVAVLERREELVCGEPDEIELAGGFFDFHEKYSLETSSIHVPARIPAPDRERGPGACPACVPCPRLPRVRAGRLLPRRGRPRPLQRGEHDPRVHGAQQVPDDDGGGRVDVRARRERDPRRGGAPMNARNAPVGGSLMLVNAAHPVPASALPERLERVRGVNGDIPLERTAARALRGLVSAVGGDGLVLAVSGFRSRGEQAAIWDEAVAENGVAFARSYVARPGCSEHETGLAVDVTLATEPYDFDPAELPGRGNRPRVQEERCPVRLHRALSRGGGARDGHRRRTLALPLRRGARAGYRAARPPP